MASPRKKKAAPKKKAEPKKAVAKKVVKKKATKKKATKAKVTKAKPKKTQQQLGRLRRESGHTFERFVVNTVKEEFEDREWAKGVRRSDQSHQANLPDVTGWPGVWSECQTALNPTPLKKLEQAERDSAGHKVIPIAITHRKKTRSYRVTLRARHMAWLIARASRLTGKDTGLPVDIDLQDFLTLYESAAVDLDQDAETIENKEKEDESDTISNSE